MTYSEGKTTCGPTLVVPGPIADLSPARGFVMIK